MMRPQLLFRKVHKWVGLVLGIQILLWFLSGFLMSWMPIDEIRGNHLLQPVKTQPIKLESLEFSPLKQQLESPVVAVTLKNWLGQQVAEVQTSDGLARFYVPSWQVVAPLDAAAVRRILAARLVPGLTIGTITRLTEVPAEVRGRQAPLWQAQLLDDENSRIYVAEATGEVVAKRTDRWRLFDFMWMLHIMDYDEREDFNHPLLYLTALSALLFTLTGFVLLYFQLRPKKRL